LTAKLRGVCTRLVRPILLYYSGGFAQFALIHHRVPSACSVILSGAFDNMVRAWDLEDPKEALESIQAHSDAVSSLVLLSRNPSQNEFTFASGCKDASVKMWTASVTEEGVQIDPVAIGQSHTSSVNALACAAHSETPVSVVCLRVCHPWWWVLVSRCAPSRSRVASECVAFTSALTWAVDLLCIVVSDGWWWWLVGVTGVVRVRARIYHVGECLTELSLPALCCLAVGVRICGSHLGYVGCTPQRRGANTVAEATTHQGPDSGAARVAVASRPGRTPRCGDWRFATDRQQDRVRLLGQDHSLLGSRIRSCSQCRGMSTSGSCRSTSECSAVQICCWCVTYSTVGWGDLLLL
jgi:WD domain, G-beta repeat